MDSNSSWITWPLTLTQHSSIRLRWKEHMLQPNRNHMWKEQKSIFISFKRKKITLDNYQLLNWCRLLTYYTKSNYRVLLCKYAIHPEQRQAFLFFYSVFLLFICINKHKFLSEDMSLNAWLYFTSLCKCNFILLYSDAISDLCLWVTSKARLLSYLCFHDTLVLPVGAAQGVRERKNK